MKGFNRYGVAGLLMILTAVLVGGTGCESSSSGSSDPLVATWRLVSVNFGAETILVDDVGISITVKLNSNGTATLTTTDEDGTETENGTWSATDTVLSITSDGETENLSYVLNGNTLTVTDDDGNTLVFRK